MLRWRKAFCIWALRFKSGLDMATRTTRARALNDEALYAYLQSKEPPEHPELTRLREVTRSLPRGRMQIAPEQGHFLTFLARLIGARRTLEIGTFTGYSALAMALALPADGRIIACDISEEWVSIGRPFWQRAGVADKIEVRIGPAIETLQQLERDGAADSFDLAFIDADKENMDGYYESALRLVRPGGLVILDNMFQGGRIIDPDNNDFRTNVVRDLNSKIAADERVDRVLVPIGDGMTLARRRGLVGAHSVLADEDRIDEPGP
jgi:predicted O-methyltransferase YrrM